jgi:spore maturation protein A
MKSFKGGKMSDWIWLVMVVGSIVYAVITGKVGEVASAIPGGCKEAATLFLTLLANLCFWSGILQIARDSKLDLLIAKLWTPILKMLFPKMKKDNPAYPLIAQNMAVNFLGLGSAATPLGLAAMNELEKQSKYGEEASPDMIRFVLVNTSTVQLIPTSLAAIRQLYGSKEPYIIMLPMLIVSVLAVISGQLMNLMLERRPP